jgi:tetratricopeptide (TPR) repeat protein
MQQALAHHRAGRLAEAEAAYRQILATRPNHAEALYLLGVIAGQTGRVEQGIDLMQQAIGFSGDNPIYYRDLGVLFQRQGRLDDTLRCCQQAVTLQPDFADAHYNLGIARMLKGEVDLAVSSFQRAAALKPAFAEAHYNLGLAWSEKGRPDQAIDCFQRAAAARPEFVEAHHSLAKAWKEQGDADRARVAYQRVLALRPNHSEAHKGLGDVWMELGQLDQAIGCFERAVELQPDFAEAHNSLGNAVRKRGRIDQAAVCYQRALSLRPDYAAAHNNLGAVWKERNQLDQAIDCYQRALALDPLFALAHNNLGIAWDFKGRPDLAIDCYQRALDAKPDYADARYNLGLARLRTGSFSDGWDLYESRWQSTGFEPRRDFPQPLWTRLDRHGGAVLLTTEQGLGDTIQFIRYAPLVADRCRQVFLECPAKLLALLQGMNGIARLIERGQPLPDFEAYCPLLSLPRIFRTTFDSIPASVPYLHADPARLAQWSAKLRSDGRLKIGLAWAGSPNHKNDRNRSLSLSAFAPLAGIFDVAFHSLQIGPAAAEAHSRPGGMEIVDHSADLSDFAETAALIANLDLVISVDTAIAHLAGAMAKPVWTLLPFAPDWRWMLDRADSPWYPTMRLFRQPAIGDWDHVMRIVADELTKLPR